MTKPISITVDTNSGDITVAPTVANCQPGDMVLWTGGTSLTIKFKAGAPFSESPLTGPGSVEKGIPLASPAGGVRYHYALTVTVGGKDYVIPGCPEIVVG